MNDILMALYRLGLLLGAIAWGLIIYFIAANWSSFSFAGKMQIGIDFTIIIVVAMLFALVIIDKRDIEELNDIK